jgi:ParB family transcriptional regulator, chromosome partitioning protein
MAKTTKSKKPTTADKTEKTSKVTIEKNGSSIGKVEEISLDRIDIGTSQVRTDASSGLDDLAQSIAKQGLIQPIYVVKKPNGRYEILAGQRRFLAHQKLKYSTIRAIVTDAGKLDDETKVAISLTENLVRRDNSQKELIDACTKLFKHYTSIKLVAEETGLSAAVVSQYVKYDQLIPQLKKKVENAQIDMRVALQAQKAATNEKGAVDSKAAEKFAAELAPMSNQQRKVFIKTVESDPTASVEEKIERGRKQPVLRQVIVTLEESLHKGLQTFAKDEGLNQDEAAANLIEDGLTRRGLVDE